MPKPIELALTDSQQHELERIVSTDQHPYMRERASALIKIASGHSGREVALNIGLKRRNEDTIYEWVHKYLSQGVLGLVAESGRGRKPAFSARHATAEAARDELMLVVHGTPQQYGVELTRWTLDALRKVCDYLEVQTRGGMSQLLKRLGISYKRARDYVHSPDTHYLDKLKSIQVCLEYARTTQGREVLVFQDELTFYRQPTLARAYELCGHTQALAYRSWSANSSQRISAVLDPLDGSVVFLRRSHFDVTGLIKFYQLVCAKYADASLIHIVQDNWPMHLHPDVRAAFLPQTFSYDLSVPRHWSKEPTAKAKFLSLPIRLELLPTYSSWTNPIEKLWRLLKQDVLHVHRLADEWKELCARVDQYLSQFANGSTDLLRYVGLSGTKNIYSHALGLAK